MSEKYYHRYADSFKSIRDKNSMCQSDFEGIGISRNKVAKFEAGLVMLSIEEMAAALQIMNTSLAEFEYLVNDFSQSDSEDLFLRLERARWLRDEEEILLVLEESLRFAYRSIELSAKSLTGQLKESEKQEIRDFLFGVEIWGLHELHFLQFCIEDLGTKMLHSLIKDLLDERQQLLKVSNYRYIIIDIIVSASKAFILSGLELSSQELLQRLQSLELCELDMLCKLSLQFIELCHAYRFDNPIKGETEVQIFFSCLRSLDFPKIEAYFSYIFDDIKKCSAKIS